MPIVVQRELKAPASDAVERLKRASLLNFAESGSHAKDVNQVRAQLIERFDRSFSLQWQSQAQSVQPRTFGALSYFRAVKRPCVAFPVAARRLGIEIQALDKEKESFLKALG